MITANPLIADIDHPVIINKKLKILHLEDLHSDALLITNALKKGKIIYEALVVDTKNDFIKALAEFAPDIILADHSLPAFNSIEALSILHKTGIKIPFILITATVSEEFAVDVMKRGADDYILKDRLERLPSAINNALKKFRLEKEQQKSLEIISNSEKRFRALIENGADAVLILTAEGRPTYVSPAVFRILGYTEEETKHLVLVQNIHPYDQAHVAQKMEECLAKPGIAIRGGIARVKHKNGTWVSMDATLTNMLHDPNINGIINNTWDVTETKIAEQKILHANRLYAFISQINQAIVHIKDEQTLFNKACTIAVEYGKFSKAFIGITDSETKKIKLTASYGMAEKDLEMLSEYDYENDGPIDKAMKGFDYVTVNDIKKAPQIKLKKYAEESGMNACIFLAIKKGGKAIGIFNIYSAETDFFTSAEIKLLMEATGDISFALDVFEKDKLKTTAELNLQAIFENTSDGFVLADKNGIIKAFNNKSRDRILLNTEQEIHVGDSIYDFIDESRKDVYRDSISKVLLGEVVRYDYPYTRKNGQTKWFSFTVNPVYNGNNITGLSITSSDITDRKIAEQKLSESELFNKGILASLHSHIAVINDSGTVITVNKAWNDFANENGATSLERVSTGSNYFEVCKKAFASGEPFAGLALDGIQSVFKKERQSFELEYPCHSPNEKRWFTMNVSNFGNDDSKVVISHQNITERKIAENKLSSTSIELQKTLTDLNKILNSSLDVICTINGNGEFINVSAASQNVWGYAPEELIGSKFMNLVYDEDADITSKAAEKIASGIQVPIFENRYVHKSGRLVNLLWSVNWDEKLKFMFCIAKDVTEKKRLEKGVENERDQFFYMFLKAPSAIGMLKGADHVFEMVNPLYLQLIGKKDVIGKTVAEVLPEVIEQGFIDLLDTVYTSGKSYTGTEVLIKLDKEGNGELTDAYLNFVYQAYKNNEGAIEGVFFFANDITEQIQSRKKIEKSEKFFKGVIENSDDMITILDLTGNTIYASPAVSKKFGYTAEECLSINIAGIVHPDDAYILQEFVMKVMMHPGVPMQCPSIRDRKKDGTYIWVTGTLTNFLDTEGINAIVANFRDITEKKKLEDLLEKTNRLARIGSWEIDVIKGTVFWSDITKEIREVDPDFIPDLSMGIQLFKEGDHRDTISKRVRDCKEKGIAWDEELQIFTQKGNLKWIRTIGEAEFINGKCVRIYGSFQDIDAKKKAETEVLKAHQERNIILESIGDAFFAVDKNWVVTYWNNRAEKMLMTPKNKIMGHQLWEIFSESVDSVSYTKYHQALENNEVVRFEDYYEQLDKWYAISAYPSANGLSVYFKDETERKHAEQSLKSERNLLRTLIDSLPDSIYFKDKAAKKLISNKFDYNLLGVTTEEAVLGKTDLDLLPAAIASITYEQDMEILKTGKPLINVEEYFTPKNRMPLWLLTTKLPLRNEKDEIIGLLGIGRDITEEKIADEKLHRSQSNLKALIENTDASIYSLDRDLRYITFNQFLHDTLDKLYGLDIKTGDSVYGFLENLKPEDARNWEVVYSKALSGEIVKFEKEFETTNDFHTYIGFSIYPIWENEKVIGLSCFAFDITKKMQEDIQKEKITADLIQRNKDLEQFSYIVSHNLRAPVANIMGLSAELIQDTHNKETTDMLKNELAVSVKRLDTVIIDLNNILNVKSGINERKEPVKLLHMVKSIQSAIRNLIQKERVQIKTDFSIIGEFVTVKSFIHSIFYNLILNSIKYRQPELAPVIEIKSQLRDGKLIITFKDNGSGFDLLKNGEHIFGLYKRFHKNIEGRGMGLFMLKAQVETLGGKITVKSEINKGATFTMEFPI
ncbi:MAG: PAS domain S-box protein [Parafilimonas sp.]